MLDQKKYLYTKQEETFSNEPITREKLKKIQNEFLKIDIKDDKKKLQNEDLKIIAQNATPPQKTMMQIQNTLNS